MYKPIDVITRYSMRGASLIMCNCGAFTPSVQRKEMQALSLCFFMHMEPVWELRISSLFSAAVI